MPKSNQNFLGIDYGSKHIGLALAIRGVISPLTVISNDKQTFSRISEIISTYQIHRIYVGLSEGKFAELTSQFIKQLKKMIKLPVETIEEAASTIEAGAIYFHNRGKVKRYQKKIDAISAAVILNRLLI